MKIFRKAYEWIGRTFSLTDAQFGKFFAGDSYTGKTITETSALQLSAVWSCVRLLSETVGSLPVSIYQRDNVGNSSKLDDHPVTQRLRHSPNDGMTGVEFVEAMQANLAIHGNAYAIIERSANTLSSLYPIVATKVNPKRLDNGYIVYEILDRGKPEIFPAEKILHLRGFGINGLVGLSPIAFARNAFGLGMIAEEYGSRFFANGGKPSGVLKIPTWLPKDQREQQRRELKELHGNIESSNSPMLLEGGIDYMPLSIPPEDSQFLETRKFQTLEICLIPGTEVLTPCGPVPIENIKIGDEVLTHKGRWRKVTQVSVRPYVGKMVTAQAKSLPPITSTPNHPFFVQIAKPNREHKIEPKGDPQWIDAGELFAAPAGKETHYEMNNGRYKYSRRSRSRKEFQSLTVPKIRACDTAEQVKIKSVDLFGDYSIIANYDLGWVCGLYAADGSSSERQVIFYLGWHEQDLVLALLERMSKIFKCKGTVSKTKCNVARVVFGGRQLASIFREFGSSANKKAFPEWCMKQCRDFNAGLVDGVVSGDGHVDGAATSLKSVSKSLIWQTRLLLWSIGIAASVTKTDAKEKTLFGRAEVTYQQEIYTLQWRASKSRRGSAGDHAGNLFFSIDKVQHSVYSGPVHNIEVDEDESYVTVSGTVHNCRMFRVPPHLIADLERATLSNVEQQGLEFLRFTLQPYLTRWEQAIYKALLTPKERTTMFARFNIDSILRADSAARAAYYSQMLQNGVYTRNEVRALENMNRMDGADELTVQVNMSPLDQLANLVESNKPQQEPVKQEAISKEWRSVEQKVDKLLAQIAQMEREKPQSNLHVVN